MSHSQYPFLLAIQITLPEEVRAQSTWRQLGLLRQLGFSGVELNMLRPERVDPAHLQAFLADYGLRMTLFASGAAAKAEGLSLSHQDRQIRQTSIQRCIDFVDFAAELKAGVIVGLLKGGTSSDRRQATDLFLDSLSRLESHVRTRQVPLLIEATNRYESSIVNSLQDAAEVISAFQNPYLRILPDTFHMNIEERSVLGSLARHRDLYDSIHLSDNNRLFPGLGGMDFASILRFLKGVNYSGGIAIEGNLRTTFEEDLRASMRLLKAVLLNL